MMNSFFSSGPVQLAGVLPRADPDPILRGASEIQKAPQAKIFDFSIAFYWVILDLKCVLLGHS
jgi:hypothetical protein